MHRGNTDCKILLFMKQVITQCTYINRDPKILIPGFIYLCIDRGLLGDLKLDFVYSGPESFRRDLGK